MGDLSVGHEWLDAAFDWQAADEVPGE